MCADLNAGKESYVRDRAHLRFTKAHGLGRVIYDDA